MANGNTSSCGCQKYRALKAYNQKQTQKALIPSGTRFGYLTVVEQAGYKTLSDNKHKRVYKCLCDCGNECIVLGNSLKYGSATSCGCRVSIGEDTIQKILDVAGIKYSHNKCLDELVKETGRRLRFDFVLYDDEDKVSRIIEFDGRQHLEGFCGGIWSNAEPYETIHERDEIKNQFCLKHNYPLVRIPYYKRYTVSLDDLFGNKYLVKGDGE